MPKPCALEITEGRVYPAYPERTFLNDTHPAPEKPIRPDPAGDSFPPEEDVTIPPPGSDQARTNEGE